MKPLLLAAPGGVDPSATRLYPSRQAPLGSKAVKELE